MASVLVVSGLAVGTPAASAAPPEDGTPVAAVARHWTPERLAAAQPRDLLVDERGLGYLRRSDGRLTPHGHQVAPVVPALRVDGSRQPGGSAPTPLARPGTGSDGAPPEVGTTDPPAGGTIGTSHTFRADVTDASGVRSVSFVLTGPDGGQRSFSAARETGDSWAVGLQGFATGTTWTWSVVATDGTKGAGNTGSTAVGSFTVASAVEEPPSDGGSSDVVVNEAWTGGDVQTAAGRIYFEMPTHRNLRSWAGYVCSGTVVADESGERSVILTAAHCVYDDVTKVFARNVLFIPDQAGGTGRTDADCTNDPMGCWAPSFGVVDREWTTRTFPDNAAWDYAYYVVPTAGAHRGTAADSDSLEAAAGTLPVQFTPPQVGARTHALGYSYDDDPHFMYCAEALTAQSAVNWWLASCGLSGGASGGPWVQPMDVAGGTGPVVSVNSWGYTDRPGMAGPLLSGSAAALLAAAESAPPAAGGVIV
jgi:hypothetical protein